MSLIEYLEQFFLENVPLTAEKIEQCLDTIKTLCSPKMLDICDYICMVLNY